MANKEIKLSDSTNSFNIYVNSADILIYSDYISEPLVRYSGDLDIKSNNNEAFITERANNNINIQTRGRNNIISTNGRTIICGSSIGNINFNGAVIVNGQIISGNTNTTIISNNDKNSVELIVPKGINNMSFSIDCKSGGLRIKDLFMLKLIAKTMCGDIKLEDINAIFAKLKTMSGDISISILESILNYETHLKTMSGDTKQKSKETESPIILEDKYQLEANTMSGDIKVLFKGRKNSINLY